MTAYCERTVSLAAKHAKERAITPPFRFALGLEVVASAGLNTDVLGTLTGPHPGLGLKCSSNLFGTPSYFSASGGESPFCVMFGHFPE